MSLDQKKVEDTLLCNDINEGAKHGEQHKYTKKTKLIQHSKKSTKGQNGLEKKNFQRGHGK